jgi:hypothetical protein
VTEDIFPELLAGAALAARFTADESVWEQFTQWCRDNGCLHPEEKMSRTRMLRASKTIFSVGRQIEIELLAEKVSESIRENPDL